LITWHSQPGFDPGTNSSAAKPKTCGIPMLKLAEMLHTSRKGCTNKSKVMCTSYWYIYSLELEGKRETKGVDKHAIEVNEC
jgi:hypothetical protein